MKTLSIKSAYLTSTNLENKLKTWKKKFAPFHNHWGTFHPEKAALLFIDLQNYFLDPSSHAFVPSAPAILSRVNEAIRRFRAMKRPIFYTRFAPHQNEKDLIKTRWGESVKEGSLESRLYSGLKPKTKEPILRKTTYSAFKNTPLLSLLQKDGVATLVIGGVLTNLCCESTAREAFDLGFQVFILMDATASYSESMHVNSLMNLTYGFATPLTVEDL